MIAGLDSSLAKPTAGQALAARAAGISLWSGYLATRPGVHILAPWSQADFDNARLCGGTPLAYCSGLDDPIACRNQAAAWNVRLCLDIEGGIRGDGAWVQGWLDASGAGLYGGVAVHAGRRAAFHILGRYPGQDPHATWDSSPRPGGPCGWQWQGSHPEFGASVDRGWYDDWFAIGGADPAFAGGSMLARNPDAAHSRRFDACFVRPDHHVMHLFSENGIVGLAQEGNLLDLGAGSFPGGSTAVPGPAWCIWEDGSHLTYVVEASDGSLWMRQEDIQGNVTVTWSVFNLGGAAVGQGQPGPAGAAGPAGPAGPPGSIASHTHPVSVTGTSGPAGP